ncbi:MAG: hypothetical protein JNK56_35480 [Myxococcales bacterium]|nr:hypothetical protein [Myxococcales bacterium]
MAFRNDPIVIGLGTTPRSGIQREGRPDAEPTPTDAGATAEECRQAYADFRALSAKTERRWQWIAAISGTAGLGLGAALGIWHARRRTTAALPESE